MQGRGSGFQRKTERRTSARNHLGANLFNGRARRFEIQDYYKKQERPQSIQGDPTRVEERRRYCPWSWWILSRTGRRGGVRRCRGEAVVARSHETVIIFNSFIQQRDRWSRSPWQSCLNTLPARKNQIKKALVDCKVLQKSRGKLQCRDSRSSISRHARIGTFFPPFFASIFTSQSSSLTRCTYFSGLLKASAMYPKESYIKISGTTTQLS